MDKYTEFAYVYDRLTDDVEYQKRVDYIEEIFKIHTKNKPELIADIGCGTGTVCNFLYDRGYDMIGIDFSSDMLNVAKEKSGDKNILYLNQNMTDFELYGTVDVILSMLDSVNYLTNDGDLDSFFKLCFNYLNYDGLLIFDINTIYKFDNVLSDNIYNFETEDGLFYSWENSFDGEICEFYLNIFVENKDGSYNRITEQHFERAYTENHIRNLLIKNGFDIVGVYEDMTFDAPSDTTQRAFFVAKKH